MADYNINAVARKVSYTGSAGVGPYAFSFEVLSEDDVAIYFNETLLTKTTDYTVTVNANGTGSVTLIVNVGGNIPATPDADDLVVIVGARDIERTTDFVTAGDLRASALNEQLDALTIMVQQVAEELERSVKAPVYDPTGINMILPKKADRVNAFVAFDANGDISAAVPSDDVTTLAEVATDISTLADIEDGTDATDAIQTVAGISSNVTTVAGISSNVTTVAGNTSNINTVAGDLSGDDDIGTVAGNISDVSSVAAIDTQVSAVAADATDIGTVATDLAGSDTIGTVATNIGNVSSVATNISNVNSVAGNETNINAVAADEADIGAVAGALTNVNTVATNISSVDAVGSDLTGLPITVDYGDLTAATNPASPSGALGTVYDISNEINTVAGIQAETVSVAGVAADVSTVSGISANVTTVAGISANVASVAGISSDVSSVAAIDSDVSSVAAIDSDVTTVATNVADITNFADVYQGPKSSDPTLRNDGSALQAGDLYFNTASDEIRVYTGSAWVAGITNVNNLLLASNNLSDLTDAQDARDNLGISDMGAL